MRLGFTAAVAVIAIPASLSAQLRPLGSMANRAPDKDASQVMITSFKTTEKPAPGKSPESGLAYVASEEMRRKVDGAFSPKQIWVIPVERINPNLVASAFSTTDALEPHDAKQLAVQIRADEYIAGTANKAGAGFKVEADLVLTRDINARQPLGSAEAPKLGDALNLLVKEYKEARKQLDGEKKCVNAVRDQKYAEAITFANAGITAYAKSTLARACLLNALYLSKAPTDEIVKVAKELSALDARSNTALRFVADAYRKGGPEKSDSLVMTLSRMMQNDSKNTTMVREAIEEIAGAKNPGIARPIIDSAVVQNPGDPELLRLRWKILGAVKDYKEMRAQGLELIRLDTSFADTTYYSTTANAYAQDSMFQQAASAAAEGVKKFPNDAYLVGFEIQLLQKAGQLQQAYDKLNNAMAAKIAVPNAGAQKISLLVALGKNDEILPVARELIAAGDTTASTRQFVINLANTKFAASQALMKTDAAGADAGFTQALGMLAFADSVATQAQKPQVAFLKGATSVLLANLKAAASQPSKSCELAKAAKGLTTDAMIALPRGGGSASKATMDQLMGMAIQLDTQLVQLINSYACK